MSLVIAYLKIEKGEKINIYWIKRRRRCDAIYLYIKNKLVMQRIKYYALTLKYYIIFYIALLA